MDTILNLTLREVVSAVILKEKKKKINETSPWGICNSI